VIDTILRSHRVLHRGSLAPLALHFRNGKIAAITNWDTLDHTATLVDVGDLVVSPGVVDSHVHINEPGRTEWEGFHTATQAAAAGGITTVVDMPLNCIPATTSARAAEQKRETLLDKLHVNVAFWGGVVPGNAGELGGLASFGVPGCKCFLCPSGVDEFPPVNARDLDLALPVLRDLGLTLLVHAEVQGPIDEAEAELLALGASNRWYDTYLRSRPNRAEDDAIDLIIALCKKHRASAHIVHLSSATALPKLAAARAEGVKITAETCLHYLAFEAERIPDGATHFKCAPPIRGAANREALWQGLEAGTVSMVVSDHSPCTPALKKLDSGDFLGAWGGIAGLQLGLSVLWTLASARGHSIAQMCEWNCAAPATLARIGSRKGRIEVGYDADVVVWNPEERFVVEPQAIHHRHPITPYAGMALQGVVEQTWVGGVMAYSRASGLRSKSCGSFTSAESAA
jgi:allantoinase